MKRILIFAGTTEGRKLSELLAESGIAHVVCVATEYGEMVLKKSSLVTVHSGRMDREEIREFIRDGGFEVIVDATHPYAAAVTENIREAAKGMDITLWRLKRDLDVSKDGGNVSYFETHEACAKALQGVKGNILITVGSRELEKYCVSPQVRDRLMVRVLPSMESLSRCTQLGIGGKQIIAMQGPFTAKMNEAVFDQYGISCLVTKQSGIPGGHREKMEAAKRAGISVFVIGYPKEDQGDSFDRICTKLEGLLGRKIQTHSRLKIILAGIGMGGEGNLTREVKEAIKEADILLGAKRMVEPYRAKQEKKPFYLAKQVIPYLRKVQEDTAFGDRRQVVILFSGDSGFYSGCRALYCALQQEIQAGGLDASVRILPGISSVAYLAACIGESYQDAAVCSMHGKEGCNAARWIKNHDKVFFLTSGVRDVRRLGEELIKAGLEDCQIITGYQLSYEDQAIERRTPAECLNAADEGLYTCFVRNCDVAYRKVTHGIRDGEFVRGRVPMTKEEVREVAVCKLHLHEHAVVYDIGSGTGSFAVEVAGLSGNIQVYAIERNEEAVSLIRQNKDKFGLENIAVVQGEAPEGLGGLPKATHAFIGGSNGKLKEIVKVLYKINPGMRVVINAATMETVSEISQVLESCPIVNEEVVLLQVSRAKKAGRYHLMEAANPVWICSFDFGEQ